MKFTPKTEKQIQEENLFSIGEYDFEITRGLDETSKAGNDMIHLTLKVFNAEGGFKLVDDYLLENIAYKIRHCADACGILDKYESGTLLGGDFEGCTGRLKLGIQKDPNGQYADKNVVKDYVKRGELASTAAKPGRPAPLNDDIPFAIAGSGLLLSLLSIGGVV